MGIGFCVISGGCNGGRGYTKWDTKWIGLDLMGRWEFDLVLFCLVVVESSGVLAG